METKIRFIQLVDEEPANLSYTKGGDAACVIDLDFVDKSLIGRQMQNHNALHGATSIWRIHGSLPIPPVIEIMHFLGGEQ